MLHLTTWDATAAAAASPGGYVTNKSSSRAVCVLNARANVRLASYCLGDLRDGLMGMRGL